MIVETHSLTRDFGPVVAVKEMTVADDQRPSEYWPETLYFGYT